MKKQLKTYAVRLPITGVIDINIEAESEDDAIEKALDSDITSDDISEWETCRQIVQGNVFHGHTNEAEAQEV